MKSFHAFTQTFLEYLDFAMLDQPEPKYNILSPSKVLPKPYQVGSTVHDTPAGQYPKEGPQPHKLPVLAYYLSVVLSIVGVLTLAKCAYLDVRIVQY